MTEGLRSPPALSPEQIQTANEALADKSPQEVLQWAVATFGQRLSMATAFGVEGCCLIHMLAEIDPSTHIFNLDTGYQFPETLELRERIRMRYGIAVEMVQPDQTVAAYEAEHGGPLYTHRPDQCCHDRKMVPLRRILADRSAWISAIRRDQTSHRAVAGVVQWDAKFGLIKVNPLLMWTKKEVWDFAVKNHVPYNPLHDRGYPSIGCWPCTAPVEEGGDDRSGRWKGSAKKECGLHVIEQESGSGI